MGIRLKPAASKALIVIGAVLIAIPVVLAAMPPDTFDPLVYDVACLVLPILGIVFLLMGIYLYHTAWTQYKDTRVPMADGRHITLEALMASISDGISRESTLLEVNAKEWGFDQWDPGHGTYDAWEEAAMKHILSSKQHLTGRKDSWFVEQGFRPPTMRFLQSRERPAEEPTQDRKG